MENCSEQFRWPQRMWTSDIENEIGTICSPKPENLPMWSWDIDDSALWFHLEGFALTVSYFVIKVSMHQNVYSYVQW